MYSYHGWMARIRELLTAVPRRTEIHTAKELHATVHREPARSSGVAPPRFSDDPLQR